MHVGVSASRQSVFMVSNTREKDINKWQRHWKIRLNEEEDPDCRADKL